MKKEKKLISLLLISFLFVLSVLGGCSKDSKEPGDSSPTPTDAVDDQSDDELEDDEFQEWLEDYPMQMGTVNVISQDIFKDDFEGGSTSLTGRGSATVEIVDTHANEGSYSLFVSGRTETWNGAQMDLSDILEDNENYLISAFVFYEEGPETLQIDCKVERNSNEYLDFASGTAKKGEWTKVTGSILIPADTSSALVYFETSYASEDLLDFYVDDISIVQETSEVERGEIPALKDVYEDYFTVGVAASTNVTSPERQELIAEQFNTITPENELKADDVLDYQTCISDSKYDDNPAISFHKVEPLLDFAQENGLKVRGHTLIWHSQTPRWFFAEGYSDDDNTPLVSRDLMLKRMENYIKNVFEYIDENYPDIFYAWDVVNEAINPIEANINTNPKGYRIDESYYYQIIGPDFIEKAFEYARKYADEDIKLFYNDYNTEETIKSNYIYDLTKDLKEKGLIDGIGLQTHLSVDYPSLVDVETSIRRYGELGLEIHLTEIDMATSENTEEGYNKQASRYKRLFTILKDLIDNDIANITNVTFWGLSDDISWLNKPGEPSYPLLFDRHLVQKPAFWGVALHPDVPLD